MTIRWYSTAAELTGTGATTMKAARFEIKLGYRASANAKPRIKTCRFTVCGESDAAVEAHAIGTAERIAEMSKYQLLGMSKVMGHYRKDRALPIVPVNQRIWATVGYTPDPTHGDGVEALNLKLFVPGFDGDNFNSSDLKALILKDTYGEDEAQISNVRWGDQDQSQLQTGGLSCVERGTVIKDEMYMVDEHLVSDNVADGVADGVLDKAQ